MNVMIIGFLSTECFRVLGEIPKLKIVPRVIELLESTDFIIMGENYIAEQSDDILCAKAFDYPELEILTDDQFINKIKMTNPEYFL